jgi:hypothetical protein
VFAEPVDVEVVTNFAGLPHRSRDTSRVDLRLELRPAGDQVNLALRLHALNLAPFSELSTAIFSALNLSDTTALFR